MDNKNETAFRQCRFLDNDHFSRLHEVFIEAFSDYVIPFALTETQFRNHIILTAVDLSRSAGCIVGDRIVGFSLNGFGEWEGRKTVYDAGTGVVPDHRRRGISEEMFAMMVATFKQEGFAQYLLEVATENRAAVSLYEKLDFRRIRELALLQCDKELKAASDLPSNIEFREIDEADWPVFTTFWDGKPSWQNSTEAVDRSSKMKRIITACIDGQCVGYIVFSSKFGRVAQIAVSKLHRNRGIGSALVQQMKAETAEGYSLQVINIDKSIESAMAFFRNRGFYERLAQFEMVKAI